VAVTLLASGCGVPHGSSESVADDEVPYHLLTTSSAQPSAPAPAATEATLPRVFFVNGDEKLVRRPLAVDGTETESAVTAVLKALAGGPSDDYRAEGLASALGPDVGLRLLGVVDRTAQIEIVPSARNPTADRLPLAVGQIVLSATSVDGVDQVTLEENGQPLSAPLPGGEQTAGPLTPDDYTALLAE
jgi:spore germination protein GerM